uniref:Uncharacterized protein n=1 Tax=Pipistrellus kuhlii TaxID=59472 RepID=A0A7J8B1P9_PIPKU|nr:hypothetical protein mPipKuh1_007773 [Pipistrellus kuhlii]
MGRWRILLRKGNWKGLGPGRNWRGGPQGTRHGRIGGSMSWGFLHGRCSNIINAPTSWGGGEEGSHTFESLGNHPWSGPAIGGVPDLEGPSHWGCRTPSPWDLASAVTWGFSLQTCFSPYVINVKQKQNEMANLRIPWRQEPMPSEVMDARQALAWEDRHIIS